MTITFLNLYNEITGQAWSMFDSEVDDKEEFETSVTTSIQKALSALWCSYKFAFRYKKYKFKTKKGVSEYSRPNGNIVQKTIRGSKVYGIKYNKNFLGYEPDYEVLEEKEGEPERFFIQYDKICLYPVPDDAYDIEVKYIAFDAACNEDGETKANLEDETDYINIDEQYEDLFKMALMPLTMTYLIASESDENYSQYKEQYEKAYKNLIDFCKGAEIDKRIGWR
ncbi:TPA: hypothetical protein CPT89_01050 [Candidatus Gastranaerophilales bacterium HUM_11]|nr:MAG TPA: hypothetical protein CPT89_01050 [Candidatus Gastranaerophilales bacterium HUM_11]